MTRGQHAAGAFALPALFILGISFAADGPKVPLGLPPFEFPASNPYSAAKAELGRLLYFDRRLSADGTVACATCHDPKFAFTDGAAFSTGIKSQKGGRSAPTVINRAYSLAQFWDGRAATLEEQAKGPMANPLEMGNTHEALVGNLRKISAYGPLFAKAFGDPAIDIDRVAMAIATFERTVLSGNSPYDRYKAGRKNAMTAEQVRGMDVYFNKAKCDKCHEGINFTSNSYNNIGVGMDKPNPDEGRFAVTKNPADWGAFKTPTLRDIEKTAPYMHDGSMKTLEEVVDFYNKGGIKNKNLSEDMKELKLTDQEKKDLVSFLKALNGDSWQKIQEPTKFPE
jgi:cytochrome c peroxidase